MCRSSIQNRIFKVSEESIEYTNYIDTAMYSD